MRRKTTDSLTNNLGKLNERAILRDLCESAVLIMLITFFSRMPTTEDILNCLANNN